MSSSALYQPLSHPHKPLKVVRIRLCLAVLLGACLLLLLAGLSSSTAGISASLSSKTSQLQDLLYWSSPISGPIRVVLREGAGWHDEVTASFMDTLRTYSDVETTVSLKARRFHIDDVYNSFAWKKEPTDLADNFTVATMTQLQPHVIISVTCGIDLRDYSQVYEHLLRDHNTVLLCVVHHSNLFYQPKIDEYKRSQAWIQAGRIRFVTMSPHVSDMLEERLLAHRIAQDRPSGPLLVSTYPPVFSVDGLFEGDKRAGRPYVVMQGSIQTERRDYDRTFRQFGHAVDLAGMPHEASPQVVVIGTGRTRPLPDDLKDTVRFLTDVPYPAFYRTLHGALALLPAFAEEVYYFTKASSTVAASLISATPMIATPLLLKKYSFLSEEEVFLRRDLESEAQASVRLAALAPLVQSKLSAAVLRKQRALISANKVALRSWLFSAARAVEEADGAGQGE